MNDPYEYYSNAATSASSHEQYNQYQDKWYENEEYEGRLIYKYEKSIPAVVQKVLEEMGFVEWDEKEHGEDEWNILWKS